MAKTFKDMTYSLLEIATNFSITDDVEYPVKWIEDALISVHNTLMREASNNGKLDSTLLQLHEKVEVKKFETGVVIDGIPVSSTSSLCYAEIPDLVSQIGQPPLDYVGAVNLQIPYSYKSFHELSDTKGTVWSLPTPSYSLFGSKVLLERKPLSKARYISVLGYFRDPRDVNTYDPDQPFPTPSEYKTELLALQHLFQGKQVTPDVMNDAQRALSMARENE